MGYIKVGKIIQIVLAVFLTLLVMLQAKGTGLSGALIDFGGYYRTKRGIEKFVFVLTVVLAIFFVVNSLVIVYF